jgi:hypothetical protein
MKSLASLVTILAIPIISGCAVLDALTPNKHFGTKIDPILNRKTTAPFYTQPQDQINRLIRKVVNSTINFPQGRVTILERETEQKENRYLVSKILNGDLKLILYTISNEKTKTKIHEHISNNKHSLAIETLDKNDLHKAWVHDKDISEPGNYTFYIKNKQGETIIIKGTESEKNDKYIEFLEAATSPRNQ